MAGKLKLTVACGDYEIVRALKDGSVEADGIELLMLTGMGSRERHWRLARKLEFDVCEMNVGAYFMAKFRGEPVTNSLEREAEARRGWPITAHHDTNGALGGARSRFPWLAGLRNCGLEASGHGRRANQR